MYIAVYNQTAVTTDEVTVGRRAGGTKNYVNVYVYGTLGGGTVTIEIKDGQGNWNSFPETIFTENTAQSIELHDNAIIRVVISGATGANVEVR